MTQRYTIEIIADAPPRLCLGDVIAGGLDRLGAGIPSLQGGEEVKAPIVFEI